MYEATDGQILVDGEPIVGLQQKRLRAQIGVVLQEPLLFQGSIAENIAYGLPEAGRSEIIAAARAANAHAFIMRFPDGYDTEVGERGGRLSGGERQRISIARAPHRQPPHPDPRRGHQLGRHPDRVRDPGSPRTA